MSIRIVENPPLVIVERRFYTDYVRLTIDRGRCIFCDVCIKVCPKNALRIIKREDGLLTLSVGENCSLCGACEPLCPSGAIDFTVNGRRINPIVSSKGFPLPLPKVIIEQSKCKEDCFECYKACFLGALKIDNKHNITVDEKKCLRCPWCEDACPENAIKVNPLFEGSIKVEESKCEDGCEACIEICPTKALVKRGGKIMVDKRYCILCNACIHLDACRNHAITVVRRRVIHGDGFSAVWTNALKNLLGERIIVKELDAESRRRLNKLVEEAKL
ncbi:MAG: 4Fe-4S dicluster domain-containing protein [Crenarchaeota archaeon]|nr:4Fe-4S dicluster domain-containing protein [Thermoproteota archaeon]MDW8034258.1 4Fe-4S dicluster domain-containing protein [Nitrososphaerota archaeon]